MTLPIRRTSRLALNLALLLLCLTAAPAAFAHAHPASTLPAADSTVSAPESVTIHFTESVEPRFTTIAVTDATGNAVSKAATSVASDGKTVSVVVPKLTAGVYTVKWVAVAVDSHRSQGDYKFTVK